MTDIPVIILAGQSNAAYAGIDNAIIDRLTARGGAFEFVKVAAGGSGLSNNPGVDWSPSSVGELFANLVAAIQLAAANVRAQGHNPVFSILWVQGEADTWQSAASYGTMLTQFIAALRAAIGSPDATFYISGLPADGNVRTAQLAVADADPNVQFIDTRGATTWDGVHYDHATTDRIALDFLNYSSLSLPVVSGYHSRLAALDVRDRGSRVDVITPEFLDTVFVSDDRPHTIYAGNGDDTLTTGAGDDVIYAGGNNDIVHSGGGNDLIELGHHDDQAWGGSGNDTIRGQLGSDTLYGEDGDDTLDGGAQNDLIHGGDGWDVLVVTGAQSAYRLIIQDDGFFLKGPDGLDWVTGVELIQFGDGSTMDLTLIVCPGMGDEAPLILPEAEIGKEREAELPHSLSPTERVGLEPHFWLYDHGHLPGETPMHHLDLWA